MKLDDLNGVNFYENAEEYGQLDDEGKAALLARHAELVSKNSIPPRRSERCKNFNKSYIFLGKLYKKKSKIRY